MTSQYLRSHGTRETSQSEPMREDQIPNSAGGYAWPVGQWEQLRRFLILGSEGGSYYASERDLTKSNIDVLRKCVLEDGVRTVNEIRDISVNGRAPKNEIAIFALAYAAGNGNEETRKAALEALPDVCRIGTHLFQFVEFVEQHRGWGRSLTRAVGEWYLRPREPKGDEGDETPEGSDSPEERHINWLAYQVVKYRQRGGMSHHDVMRLAHPKMGTPELQEISGFVTGQVDHKQWIDDKNRIVRKGDPWVPSDATPKVIRGYLAAQKPDADLPKLIKEYGLPREALPSESLNSPDVWEALLFEGGKYGMPITALIRNLANMTRIGLLTPSSKATQKVVEMLGAEKLIQHARVHPISILFALSTYASGRGFRGSNTWNPIPAVVDALDEAFYLSFQNVEPTGKRHLLALDISGSMDQGVIAGTNLTPRAASSAMAMVTVRTEALFETVGFYAGTGGWTSPFKGRWTGMGYGNVTEDGLTPIALSKRQRLDDVVQNTNRLPMGGTDCALPMLYALDKDREVDVFVVYTDNETWAGNIHPAQALKKYREQSGISAKLIVVGMTATEFTIADPNDAGMMDVVGFDTAAPAVMAEFVSGNV